MEQWSVEDERPYLRPERSTFPWIVAGLAIALIAGIGYYYYSLPAREVQPAPVAKTEPAPKADVKPAIQHPLPGPQVAMSLPTLEMSDAMMRESLVGLLGRKAFDEFLAPDRLIRRIVATVDNLPRRTAPRRMMPIDPVRGRFITSGGGGAFTLDPANSGRYAPYVKLAEAVPTPALVATYVQAYPLFQRAYEELGFGGKYFNDRLLEAIDDLLAAPEVGTPIKLLQAKVLYEFADPELETRSAGQKILIRIGAENARKVKAKLLEIRQELAAASTRKP